MRQIWNTLAIGALAIPLGYPAQAADVRQVPTMSRPLLDNAPLMVDEFSSGGTCAATSAIAKTRSTKRSTLKPRF